MIFQRRQTKGSTADFGFSLKSIGTLDHSRRTERHLHMDRILNGDCSFSPCIRLWKSMRNHLLHSTYIFALFFERMWVHTAGFFIKSIPQSVDRPRRHLNRMFVLYINLACIALYHCFRTILKSITMKKEKLPQILCIPASILPKKVQWLLVLFI